METNTQVAPSTEEVVAPVNVLERKAILPEEQAEILKLFKDFQELSKKARQANLVFVDFVRTVRQNHGISDEDKGWGISDDASYFEKMVEPIEQFDSVPPAQRATTPEGEDASLEAVKQ